MKRIFRNKFIACIIAAVVALFAAVFAIFPFSKTTTAQAYILTGDDANMPTGTDAIGNIYKDNGKFSKDYLDLLAQKAGYTGLDSMVTAAAGGTIKTSNDFGNTVVNFGSYTFNGTAHELTWIPAYLSNSDDGPILTLWLANTANENGTFSNQEKSTWSEGTYNGNKDTEPSSDNYSTSYIRSVTLNNGGAYYGDYGNVSTIVTPTSTKYTATSDGSNKFELFTTGVLKDYIVTPSQVSWQSTANKMKNDPNWAGSNNGHYTPRAWLSDKLWLPSVYEILDTTIPENSTLGTVGENGGLWNLSVEKRSNSQSAWLRSGYYSSYQFGCLVNQAGGYNISYVYFNYAVRPALHLNLAMVKESAEYHEHEWLVNGNTDADGWKVTKAATCSAKGEEERVCTAKCCTLTGNKETRETAIDPNAHKAGAAATCTTDQTCTLCGTVLAQQTGHSYGDWVEKTPASCTTDRKEEHSCSKCGANEEQTVADTKQGHLYGTPTWDWTADYSSATAKFTCTRSGCSYIHSLSATVTTSTTAATCMAAGKTTYTATLAVTGAEFPQSTYTDPQEVPIAQLNHIAAPTWSKDSDNHWHECTRDCGTKLDKAAHTYTIWKVDTPATLTSTGVGHHECVCGARGADEEIPVVTCLHTNKSQVAAVEATCISEGNPEYWHCNDCGKNLNSANTEISTIVTPIDPNNHKAWGDWQPVTAATCVAKGSEKRTCAVCSYEETREIAIALDAHDIEHHEAKTANCTEAGWGEYDTCSRCDYTTKTEIPALDHNWATEWSKDETNHWHECSRCDAINGEAAHTHEWVITTPATTEADGLMENLCTECGHKDGEEVIAKLDDGNGNEIDLPVDIDVEFNVTQSNTGNYYSDIDKGLKRGYWAQLWYRNGDGTLGDEFTDKINCFLTLKIPDEIVKGILNGEPISRDKIAEGLSVYYIDENGTPVEVENFTIVLREDNSCQIKFNYNDKFRAEVVFAADVEAQPTAEPKAGIPWWVWLLVVIGCLTVIGVVIVIIVVAKKKNGNTTVVQGTNYDDAHIREHLSEQDRKLDEIREIVDGGFNDTMDE